MKNSTELKGDWEEIKRKLKLKFSILTDRDLLMGKEKQEEILERLQKKLGKSKEEIKKIIAAL